MITKILAFLKRERFQVVGVIACLVIILTGLCCESQTRSIADPTQKVTRAQLKAEIDKLLIDINQRYAHLDRQDELKTLLFEQLMLWSATGTFNPNGLIPLLMFLLGTAAVADNVDKRREIKKLCNKTA